MPKQINLRLGLTQPKPSSEQLKNWRRRLTKIRWACTSNIKWVKAFHFSIAKAVKQRKILSQKQQYWLAILSGEMDWYITEDETEEERKMREVNSLLDGEANVQFMEEVPSLTT